MSPFSFWRMPRLTWPPVFSRWLIALLPTLAINPGITLDSFSHTLYFRLLIQIRLLSPQNFKFDPSFSIAIPSLGLIFPPLELCCIVQSFSHVWLLASPWTAAHLVSLSFTMSWSLLKLISVELVIPSNHLVLPSNSPNIRVFSSESALGIRSPKNWSLFQHQSFQWIFSVDFL